MQGNNVHITHFKKVDPIMAELSKRFVVRPPKRKTANRFEYLTLTILYQQLAGKAADAISKRFRALFAVDDFPAPAEILKLDADTLRSVGISRGKASYILDLAAKVHSGEVKLLHLHKLEDEQVITELTKVKGIGRWTAEMFLMSALGRPDIFSFGDLGLQTAIKKAYGMKRLPSKRTMEWLSKKWSPHRTIAARILWASLDNE
jgi:DNA-3-methyladenine glycosylase II